MSPCAFCDRKTQQIIRTHLQNTDSTLFGLVLKKYNNGAYLKVKSIFHKTLNSFQTARDITLESIPETNQY